MKDKSSAKFNAKLLFKSVFPEIKNYWIRPVSDYLSWRVLRPNCVTARSAITVSYTGWPGIRTILFLKVAKFSIA